MAKKKAAKSNGSNGSNGKTNGAGGKSGKNGKATTVPALNFTEPQATRVAVPVVDEDGVERPSVEVHTQAPASTGTRYLKCELTDDEILCLRVEREAEDEKIEDLQDELDKAAELVKSLKRRVEVLQESGAGKSRTIRLGYEWRNVPCVDRRGPDPREDAIDGAIGVCTFRLDTDECIEWRELRADERQGALFDDAAPAQA